MSVTSVARNIPRRTRAAVFSKARTASVLTHGDFEPIIVADGIALADCLADVAAAQALRATASKPLHAKK